ncbi:DUF2933 domain-containing protein [Streptomyces sp. NPDC059071]|uniref:DUF2933 domain-containing protein n=1 Tax=unclassified Streptomyces TaxID=2593676 RepID=UPI00362F12FC
MKQNQWGLYAIAVAIAVVGTLALGLPVGTLAFLGVALACPLMMFFMMRGMHGQDMHDGHDDRHEDHDRNESGRP